MKFSLECDISEWEVVGFISLLLFLTLVIGFLRVMFLIVP